MNIVPNLVGRSGSFHKNTPKTTVPSKTTTTTTTPPSDLVNLSHGNSAAPGLLVLRDHTSLANNPQPVSEAKPSQTDSTLSFLGEDWLVAGQGSPKSGNSQAPLETYQQLQNSKEKLGRIQEIYRKSDQATLEAQRERAAILRRTSNELSDLIAQNYESGQNYADRRFGYFLKDIEGPDLDL